LGGAALAALLCATAHAARRPRLDVRRVAEPDRVTRGEASTVTLTVHNTGRLTTSLVAYDRCGGDRVAVPLLRLRPGRDAVVRYPVPTHRRGVVDLGPLRLTRTDPLGLVTVTLAYGEAIRVWVRPRRHPLAAVPTGVSPSLDGRIDRVPHGSITFAALREYVVGDELRHVHWRTSARIGRLMVREHLDTSLPRIAVLLDDRAASWPGAADGSGPTTDGFEAACEAAASIVAAAAREDLAVTLHLVSAAENGGPVEPSVGGFASAGPLLDRLAEATLTGPVPRSATETSTSESRALADATARLRQHRVGDTLVYLTGAGGLADLAPVAALRGAYPTVVACVLGTDGPVPPTAHGVLVLTAADGRGFAAAWDRIRAW
ncbi:MAG: DUF58 domain-containing protein, partial [Dactylosporangium sp.]|nr:DUF58 domain-containing protein [Dactylosporangium sp.]